MIQRILLTPTAIIFLLSLSVAVHARIDAVPEPFKSANTNSTYRIKYDDVSKLLRVAVVNTGRSSRDYAAPPMAKTGTRMRQTFNRATVNEGNRFYFELFQGNDDAVAVLRNMKNALEAIPSQVTLEAFSRHEQLAYWLNLYNVTLINEIVKIYPKRNLKDVMVGNQSVFDKHTLNVAGIPLSLNDVEFILWKNHDGDPLIIYGLYQGVIGGPNIRKSAYTATNVYRGLRDNAREFINSNRGTRASRSKDENTFHVSSLYERDTLFFDSDETLKQHLLSYLESPEYQQLRSASQIKRDIDDWTITDLYGSYRNLAGTMADNPAAMLNAIQGSESGAVATMSTAFASAANNVPTSARYSTELLIRLKAINDRRMRTSEQNATVTIEELGTVEVDAGNPDQDQE